MCWDIPQPVLTPQYPCWEELLGLLLHSWRCLWSQTCCPGRAWPPVLCCVSPTLPQLLGGRCPKSSLFTQHPPDLFPLPQVEQLYLRQMVDEAGKTCSSSPMLPMADEPQHDQGYRIFQDICATRPLFRENQQIAV